MPRVFTGWRVGTLQERAVPIALHDLGDVFRVPDVGEVGRFCLEGFHTGRSCYEATVLRIEEKVEERTVFVEVDRLVRVGIPGT